MVQRTSVGPVNCPVPLVLKFLQDIFSVGLSPSTLKVYVAAIAAFHAPLSGGSLGKHHLVIRFLHGTLRTRPVVQLEGLSLAPFEPLDSASVKRITLKMVFLLPITSLKE